MNLNVNLNFHEPGRQYLRPYAPGDQFYEALTQLHHGLNDEQSTQVNARLVLLLANHIGNLSILREAMAIAQEDI
ncbi:DUF2783 domain-containing protein [Castellaniella sp.]|uniref:DUF2783 domain-containing protein n=1 Tax=Castellaniella sp. TaxID=1955812 RepID=UPI003C71641A